MPYKSKSRSIRNLRKKRVSKKRVSKKSVSKKRVSKKAKGRKLNRSKSRSNNLKLPEGTRNNINSSLMVLERREF